MTMFSLDESLVFDAIRSISPNAAEPREGGGSATSGSGDFGDGTASGSAEVEHTREVAERFARATWSGIAEPGDLVAGILVRALGADAALTALLERHTRARVLNALAEAGVDDVQPNALSTAFERWMPRLAANSALSSIRLAARCGAHLVTPADDEWPASLADLGQHEPLALWVRGEPAAVGRMTDSVALVGARAATGYGEHVAMELSAGLSDRGVGIVSGAAYGIDGMAHRAALASSGFTVAFLAGGVDRFYPSGHDALLTRIASLGLVVSELPCGSPPTKWRFLQQSRRINTMARVVIYARQSEDVAEGIDRQIARCRALAEARGWQVEREYVDNDVSAAKLRSDKTAWAAMLRDLDVGLADVVIAVDLDRLLRSTRDLVSITDTGARVLTVDGEIDLTTADGEFRATMLAGIARFEVRRKSERQRRANESRRESGRPTPGRRRYGYETDGVTPRDAEAIEVRRMFEHVAGGGSLRSLAADLQARGVDPAPGKSWSSRRLRELLTSPYYSGSIVHEGQALPSTFVTPIVGASLADDVRALLRDPSRRTTPGPKPKHLLSGIARCHNCGERLVYMRSYRCIKSSADVSILKETLESRVRDEVARAFIFGGPDLFPAASGGAAFAQRVADYERNLSAVDAVIADRDEGLVPPLVARKRLVELKEARELIEADIERARTERSAASALLEIAQSLLIDRVTSAGQAGANYDELKRSVLDRFDALDIDKQREIVRALVHVEVAPGRDTGCVHIAHLIAAGLNEPSVEIAPRRDPRRPGYRVPRAVREGSVREQS